MQYIVMPKLGLTMKSGFIARWIKKEGDWVNAGEPVVEIESDKTTHEVESPVAGYLTKILAEEGEEIVVAATICMVGEKS